jgi:DNA-directed RNA polymerase specialized sigma24 family protein
MHTPDHDLMIRTRHGDHAAATDLWSRYAASVRAYAIGVLGRRAGSDLADDIVQCVFCRILELPLPQLNSIRDVPAWLMSVARNEALNHLRAMRRRAKLSASPPGELARAIERLARRNREVIVLRHVVGLSFDAMALATGLARSTVASRYAIAVQELQDQLMPKGRTHSPATLRVEVHHA